jgi:hypothetical protein
LFEGGYDKEEKAAKAYDLAALKYWGPTTHINFPVGFSFRDSITFMLCYTPVEPNGCSSVVGAWS